MRGDSEMFVHPYEIVSRIPYGLGFLYSVSLFGVIIPLGGGFYADRIFSGS